ncbi:hypothetical protein BJY52DRAFT_1270667 [Lactarius psammicola]|nr:hypothetical protein BJY52DRAFT_1270667 [Lactarius psammicola]
MLGRASARVDENSRKRMRAARSVRTLRSPLKGKDRVRAAAGTRSLDELDDHTNILHAASEHRAGTSGTHYSSLPAMPPKVCPSQAVGDASLTDTDADDVSILNVDPDACAGAADNAGDSYSSRARSVTQHVPPHSSTTGHPQGRAGSPSPTPVRPAPTTLCPPPKPAAAASAAPTKPTPLAPPSLAPLASACPQHPVPTPTRPSATDAVAGAAARKRARGSAVPITPESLPRRGASASTTTTTITASQSLLSSSQGPRRALGMTRTAASSASASASASSSKVQHSAAVKRPFRPPRVQVPTKSQWQQKETKSPGGSDPDSSFDLAFDFDPEALEAAMRPYD